MMKEFIHRNSDENNRDVKANSAGNLLNSGGMMPDPSEKIMRMPEDKSIKMMPEPAVARKMLEGKDSFDKETATQRLQSTENIKEFALLDASGQPVKYSEEEASTGNKDAIFLPEGTLVSKLDPNPDNPDHIHVIAWYRGQYREGYISQSAFSGNYEGGSPYDVEVFIEDAHHTLHRFDLLMQEKSKHGKPYEDPMLANIINMAASVKADLELYKKGELKITKEMLERIGDKEEADLKIEQGDKPGSMQRLFTSIFEKTNPLTRDKEKLSDTAMFVPLTDTWFKSDEKLKDHFNNVMLRDGNLNRVSGDTGEGIEVADYIKGWFIEFAVLRNLIKGTPAAESPEGKWLSSITAADEKRVKRMIFVGGDAWVNMAGGKDRYASSVAVSTSFGPLKASPMELLIMHELNVNTGNMSLMGEDSHIDENDTKKAWQTASSGNFSSIASNSDSLDDLFQSQSGIAITMLHGYLQKIKNEQ